MKSLMLATVLGAASIGGALGSSLPCAVESLRAAEVSPTGATSASGVQAGNAGFEDGKVADYEFGIKEWRCETPAGRNTSAGVFGASRGALPKVPSGSQCAFLFGDPGVAWVRISQDVGGVRSGRTYRLTVQVGRQKPGGDGRCDLPPYRIVLRDGRDDSVVASAASPVTPEPGTFAPATLDYTAKASHPLRISFEADSTARSTVVLFDDVAIKLARTADEEMKDREQLAYFDERIAPLLRGRCVECHQAKKQKGGLRLDTIVWLMRGGDSGPVVKPGDPAGSEMIQRIGTGEAARRMPPKGAALSAAEVALIEKWVRHGAVASDSPLLAEAAKEAVNLDPDFMGRVGGNTQERLVNRRAARLALVEKPAPPPTVDGAVFNDIDRFIVERWRENKLPASADPAVCDDPTFLRRVYLDVIGAAPTLTQTQRFLDDSRADKRARLIDELLERHTDYAGHWTAFWLDALASNVAATFGGVVSRGDHLPWIHSSFAQNKPYDVFVAELIDPTMPGFKQPASIEILGVRYKVGFLRDAEHKEVLQTAADVGQIFLGTGMKCASCHSHFENDEWPQKRFLAFAGYFTGKDLEQVRCEKRTGVFVPAASPFDQPGIPAMAPADANGRLHLAALLLTDPANPRFAKTIVNRLWKRYLGLGLFEPADDFRLDVPPSHPKLLDWLAYDFMGHGYDIKHTVRLILNSRTYQLRHDAKSEDKIDVLHPRDSVRLFRSPALRRLTAEQLLDSLAVVTTQKLDDRKRVYRAFEGVPDSLNNALGRPDIRSEVSTARSGEAAIVQALELLNGARYNALMNADVLLGRLGESPEPRAVVELVYLAALQRRPGDKELKLGVAFLQLSLTEGKLPPSQAVRDMLWAIATSPSFQYVN
jgi:hypothetical protein